MLMGATARHYARLGAAQYLYAWACDRDSIGDDEQQLLLDTDVIRFGDLSYFRKLLSEIPDKIPTLDKLIEGGSHRGVGFIDPVELSILRLGTYELTYGRDIPIKVVIDECIELSKSLCDAESYKFVNAVLDKVAFRAVRDAESDSSYSPKGLAGEFDIISKHFSRPGNDRADVEEGIGDDAAIVRLSGSHRLAVTTDTLIEGVHFLSTALASDVGYKTLAVSASDLAAMGASPAYAILNLSIPHRDDAWLEQFSNGFFELADELGVALIGGDTVRGPLSAGVALFGTVGADTWLSRSGAQPGDGIYVTGTLGDAALGLSIEKGDFEVPAAQASHFRSRLARPQPRVGAGLALRDIATAAIDISDGLMADLRHVLNASGVGARVTLQDIPISRHYRKQLPRAGWDYAFSRGDDYELCFTMPEPDAGNMSELVERIGLPITKIGEITAETGLHLLGESGDVMPVDAEGYTHF